MMSVRRSLLVLLAAAFAAPAAAQSNEFEQQVAFQMSVAEAFANSVGYEMTHSMIYSSLDEGESETFTLDVDGGKDYRMISLCDEDCDDIDIYLEDMNGNVIDEDISLNDAPVVGLTAKGESRYRIRVHMYSCSIEPCYFAIGVFGR